MQQTCRESHPPPRRGHIVTSGGNFARGRLPPGSLSLVCSGGGPFPRRGAFRPNDLQEQTDQTMAGNLLPSGDPPGPLVQPPAATPAPALDYDLTPFQPPADGGGIPWRRYISALRRYKWLMLLVIMVGTGATVLATRFMKP